MKRLQSLPIEGDICVTLNGGDHLPTSRVLAEMDYEHPVFTTAGVRAQQRQQQINGARRTFYCGAYWRYGFHEDGVVSALDAINHFQQWAKGHVQLPLHRAS